MQTVRYSKTEYKLDITVIKLRKSRGKILELIRNDSKISVPEIAEIVGLSIKSVEKNIRQLKKEGIIVRTTDTKSGEWIVNE